jgi:hypothetical protein
VTAYLQWLGTGNNNWYGLDMLVNGASAGLIGGMVWSNAYTAAGVTVSGTFTGDLAAGDTLAIAWNVLSGNESPNLGQLNIRMEFPS